MFGGSNIFGMYGIFFIINLILQLIGGLFTPAAS